MIECALTRCASSALIFCSEGAPLASITTWVCSFSSSGMRSAFGARRGLVAFGVIVQAQCWRGSATRAMCSRRMPTTTATLITKMTPKNSQRDRRAEQPAARAR